MFKDLFIVIPVTTKLKTGSWYHQLKLNSTDIVEQVHQVKIISTARLQKEMGKISKIEMKEIKQKLFNLLK